MTRPAESTHWYDRDGKPAYTVKGLNGKERPTTLKDARKLGLVPSVTSIIKCADRPGLNRWLEEQILLAALTLPRQPDEPEEEWLVRVRVDSREQAKNAAERGTAIHAAIQGYYEGSQRDLHPRMWDEHVFGASRAVDGWIPADWSAESSFANDLGFGGKVDLSCSIAVIDFKTKEFDEEDKLDTWPEQHMQLAAYREGLLMPQARCAIVYVSVTNPGLSRLIEITEKDLQRGWDCFKALLAFWRAKHRYKPVPQQCDSALQA